MSIVWRMLAQVRGTAAAEAVFALVDAAAGAVSAFETAPGEWRIEAYPRLPILVPALTARLAMAAAGEGGALLEIGEERLPERDWVAENQLAFPPLRVGRFFIYGSHHRDKVPVGAIGIALDAATAFGTGEHPSTRGCLNALQDLARRRRFRHPLDIGTGTGILAIAAAKLLRRPVPARDIDAGAVVVAGRNLKRNGVAGLVQVGRAVGYRDRLLHRHHYDLIFSNILARPLALMAADLARAMLPGGRAVLSGLLRRQEAIVLAPHRGCRIVLESRVVIDGWSTLILRAGPVSETAMGAEAPIHWHREVERSVRRPCAGRVLRAFAKRPTPPIGRPGDRLRRPHGSPSGEFRYPRATGRRAPSVRQKRVPGDASRKRPSRPRGRGSQRT